MIKKHVTANSCKCQGCGDDMIFSPETGGLVCLSCKGTRTIPSSSEYAKHDFVENKENADNNDGLEQANRSIQCPNCGAIVQLRGYQMSSSCPYCSSELIVQQESLAGLKPDAVIPFKFGKEKAKNVFRDKIARNWFVPNKFKKNISADNIEAYYFPAFVYNSAAKSTYEGRLYEEYTVRRGDKTETRRRYFRISGEKETRHDGVEIEASTRLEQAELDWVRPYQMDKAVCYTKEYVSGFDVESYSASLKDTFTQATDIMKKEITHRILNGYRYDGVSYLKVDTKFYNTKYSYCLLPIYRINYKYRNKNYSNVMNGQSGALGGHTPKSALKITFTVLSPILIMLAIVLAVVLL